MESFLTNENKHYFVLHRSGTFSVKGQREIILGIADNTLQWQDNRATSNILKKKKKMDVTKEIQPVHPKGDQSWVFIGRTDVEAESPILWPAEAKS